MDGHANFGYSTVATAPSPAASGTTLTPADAIAFPDPASIGPYNVTVWPISETPIRTNAEIVRVTAKSGSQLTITRAQEGTSARSILVGDQLALAITKKVITDIEDGVSALSQAVSVLSQGLSAETSARTAKDDTLSNAISVISS